MSLLEVRKHLDAAVRDRKREQEKKEMQLRYERSAAIKKAAQEQQTLGDVFLNRSLEMLQPTMAGPRHSASVSEATRESVSALRKSLSID